ncbi:MAG: FHA domain-containing protein [Microbacteriaceae bacterium]
MTPALRYRPATDQAWLTLVCGQRVLVVESSAVASADTLISLLSGEGSAAIVDEVTDTGLSLSPAFALVTFAVSDVTGTASAHCVVRGDITISLQSLAGPEVVQSATDTVPVEKSFTDVTGFSVGVVDEAAETLPLSSGAAWSSDVSWSCAMVASTEAAESSPNTATILTPAVESEVNDSTVVMDDRLRRPRGAARLANALGVEPVIAESQEEISESTIVMENSLKRERIGAVADVTPGETGAPESPDVPETADVPDAAEAPDHTVVIDRTAPKPAPALAESIAPAADAVNDQAGDDVPDHTVVIDRPAAPPVASDEHDGATVVVDRGALSSAKEAAAKDAAAKEAAATAVMPNPPRDALSMTSRTPSYYLALSTGERASLAQPVLVGRSPKAPADASGPIPKLVAIAGDKDISRTHVRFALEGDSIVVTDLHSRNGTSIALPGRSPQRLRGGEPTTVLIGTLVDLGNGITITLLEE